MQTARSVAVLFVLPLAAAAGEADVRDAEASCDNRTCRFSVTVEHSDAGWDHYADKWEILDPQGEIIAVRELAHPHDSEQPFTRSLGGVRIPPGVERVTLRAHDSMHGYGGREFKLELTD